MRAGLLSVLVALSSCAAPPLGPLVEEVMDVPIAAAGAARADLDLRFFGGTITAQPDPAVAVATVVSRDNRPDIQAHCSHRTDAGTVAASFWLEAEERISSRDEETIDWRLALGRKLPTSLRAQLAACDADLDLGGARLENVDLEASATQTKLRFSQPNAGTMESLRFRVASADGRLEQLGNAHVRSVRVEVDVGQLVIDASGAWEGTTFLRVDANVAGVEIRVPRSLAVKVVVTQEEVGDVTLPDFHRGGDGAYWSDSPDGAPPQLVIEVAVAVGNVQITRI